MLLTYNRFYGRGLPCWDCRPSALQTSCGLPQIHLRLVQGPVPWEEIEKMSLCTPRSWMDDHDSDISDPDSDDRITIYTNEPSPTLSEMLTKSVCCKVCFTIETASEAAGWPDDLHCTWLLEDRIAMAAMPGKQVSLATTGQCMVAIRCSLITMLRVMLLRSKNYRSDKHLCVLQGDMQSELWATPRSRLSPEPVRIASDWMCCIVRILRIESRERLHMHLRSMVSLVCAMCVPCVETCKLH
jgi:hypothetical protein